STNWSTPGAILARPPPPSAPAPPGRNNATRPWPPHGPQKISHHAGMQSGVCLPFGGMPPCHCPADGMPARLDIMDVMRNLDRKPLIILRLSLAGETADYPIWDGGAFIRDRKS